MFSNISVSFPEEIAMALYFSRNMSHGQPNVKELVRHLDTKNIYGVN